MALCAVASVVLTALSASSRCSNMAKAIPDEYQIVLSHDAPEHLLEYLVSHLHGRRHVIAAGSAHAFRSVFARMDSAKAERISEKKGVRFVEKNYVTRASVIPNTTTTLCPDQQSPPVSWGQSRVTSEGPANAGGSYRHNASWGTGVDVYVLDTGVRITHEDFGGTALWGATFAGTEGLDTFNHGTHVASIIGGRTYGVAKGSTIIAVKVIGDLGEGTYDEAISGLEWVVHEVQRRNRRGVINMSIGGYISEALNAAVAAAVSAGVPVFAAAGNCAYDSCRNSPSSAPTAITVGSTELVNDGGAQVDGRAPLSNTGECVDIFAPGIQIVAASAEGDGSYIAQSGTSMAAPHAAAAAAAALSWSGDLTAENVRQILLEHSQKDIILDPGEGSPNRMLHIPC